MDKAAKIYIAGHRGMVGSAIVRSLTSQGYSNLITKNSDELDLTNQQATTDFFAQQQPEYVFLAAAKVGGILANDTYRADFIYDNLQIQNNVIGASFQHKVKKLLFLGSSCIYPKEAPQPINENSLLTGPLEYTNEPYAVAKIAGIKLIENFNIQYGTNYLAIQPTNLYGYNDNFDLETAHAFPMIVRKFILAKFLEGKEFDALAKDLGIENKTDLILKTLFKYGIAAKEGVVTVTLWGTGKPYREFLSVDDMAEASIFVMNNVNFSDLTNGMKEIKNTQINIGTGSDITIKDFANLAKKVVGFNGVVDFDQTHPDGTMRKLLNVDKIHQLGWHHKIDLEAGLRQTIDWYRKEHPSG